MLHHPRLRGTVAGLLTAATSLGVAELISGTVRGTPSPVVSVGNWVIDHVPSGVKSFAIRTFGANDKVALIAGTLAVLAVSAAVLGVIATTRFRIGAAGIVLFGVIGAAAALTRPTGRAVDVLPSVVGTVAGVIALRFLVGRPPAEQPPDGEASAADDRVVTTAAPAPDLAASGLDRRRFLLTAATTAAVAGSTAGLGRALRSRFSVSAARSALRLPAPASVAAPVPAGADLGVPGIASFVTPNADFYRVDTTLATPQVDPANWTLRVKGMVDHELRLSFDDLLSRPMIERDITLVCVSNEVGGTYAGTARWLGVPLADLLREAGVHSTADQLVSRSVDGWTAGSPVADVMDGRDAMIAVGMNGEPLPVAHGFPARLIVPGLYGFVSATKWLTELELTTFSAFDPYWARRGWAKQAPIKTLSRIDTPRGLSRVPAGRTAIGGVAWAVHRGIDSVEVRIDDGPWQPAQLAPSPTTDTWRQWTLPWDATSGNHTITCRSTDATGALQTDQRVQPIPDGASGWHSVVVIVE